ncbi:MAG: Rne/Rng family ribonuclease [Propionibacteriales bacterium]|nr:Rne/Rng family ribonuclease [Propionibacteriales bacterium]
MLDHESDQTPEHASSSDATSVATTDEAPGRTAAKKTAKKAPAKKTTKKAPAMKAATKKAAASSTADGSAEVPTADQTPAKKVAAKKTAAKKAPAKKAAKKAAQSAAADEAATDGAAPAATSLLFQPPDPVKAVPRKRATKKAAPEAESPSDEPAQDSADPSGKAVGKSADDRAEGRGDQDDDQGDDQGDGTRRRRRRGGRRRRKGGQSDGAEDGASADDGSEQPVDKSADKSGDKSADKSGDSDEGDDAGEQGGSGPTRRRRRRRRSGEGADGSPDDPTNTVVRVREPRKSSDDEITGVSGSTRLEAKKQRRREGREAGRRRPPIVSEAEFLARRESVERVMVVRQREDLTQIAVLEDKMLVEHYVARESQTSLIGNVYLGRVQNVLPSMEAAFVDIGKGRNAVLYAGEVNWSALGSNGQPRRIESALKSGQPVLTQVTKDPIGHKGARLTSQVSLPGRYLVYVPDGQTSGISRKLPDTERNRLKSLLKEILPDDAGVIIRTAAEGASEDELRRDVARLTARWEDIEKKVEAGQAPNLLYGEPDLMVKVIRDLFTEDFGKLVVSGDDAWDTIEGYVAHVAPDLMDRVERWTDDEGDVFASYRVDEQIAKGLDRKVFLPSGGSLVIDRTEAMTVVDVNTGKFTGSGGNLEETVTKNNLEAAEEIVRQLRLRDIGGIIVVDFIDMVLESNRDLVLRRLIECLGRDRTKHQVAEVTSLGLVQMTRKRIGTGLLEAFSETCEHCQGRGLHVHHEPVEPKKPKRDEDEPRRGKRGRRRGGDDNGDKAQAKPDASANGKPKDDKPKDDKPKDDKPKGDRPKRQRLPKDEPKDEPAAEAQADADPEGEPEVPSQAPEVPAETGPEPAPDAAAEPPKRQRRRASRSQGKAEQPTSEQPAEAVAPTEPVEPVVQPEPQPVTEPVGEPQPEPQPVAEPVTESTPEPAAPRRTRRRAATRPAGPPQ